MVTLRKQNISFVFLFKVVFEKHNLFFFFEHQLAQFCISSKEKRKKYMNSLNISHGTVKESGKFFDPMFFATCGQEINILTHFMPLVSFNTP